MAFSLKATVGGLNIGQWVPITLSAQHDSEPNADVIIKPGPGVKFYFDDDGIGDPQGPFDNTNAPAVLVGGPFGSIIEVQGLAPGALGATTTRYIVVDGVTYICELNTKPSVDSSPNLPKVKQKITISGPDGAPLANATVKVRMPDTAFSTSYGSVWQQELSAVTDVTGEAFFNLVSFPGMPAYEVTCHHPVTGKEIYGKQKFTVFGTTIEAGILKYITDNPGG